MSLQDILKSLVNKSSSPQTGGVDAVTARYDEYLRLAEEILFEGTYLEVLPRKLIISQTQKESELLGDGILIAEIYTPANDWHSPIIGTYSPQKIEAYSVGPIQIFRLGSLTDLKERISATSQGEESQVILKDFPSFSDIITFLKENSSTSYVLTEQEGDSWIGKEIFKGITLIYGHDNIGAAETGMRLTRPYYQLKSN